MRQDIDNADSGENRKCYEAQAVMLSAGAIGLGAMMSVSSPSNFSQLTLAAENFDGATGMDLTLNADTSSPAVMVETVAVTNVIKGAQQNNNQVVSSTPLTSSALPLTTSGQSMVNTPAATPVQPTPVAFSTATPFVAAPAPAAQVQGPVQAQPQGQAQYQVPGPVQNLNMSAVSPVNLQLAFSNSNASLYAEIGASPQGNQFGSMGRGGMDGEGFGPRGGSPGFANNNIPHHHHIHHHHHEQGSPMYGGQGAASHYGRPGMPMPPMAPPRPHMQPPQYPYYGPAPAPMMAPGYPPYAPPTMPYAPPYAPPMPPMVPPMVPPMAPPMAAPYVTAPGKEPTVYTRKEHDEHLEVMERFRTIDQAESAVKLFRFAKGLRNADESGDSYYDGTDEGDGGSSSE